jgi:hypothetical protein
MLPPTVKGFDTQTKADMLELARGYIASGMSPGLAAFSRTTVRLMEEHETMMRALAAAEAAAPDRPHDPAPSTPSDPTIVEDLRGRILAATARINQLILERCPAGHDKTRGRCKAYACDELSAVAEILKAEPVGADA